MLPVIQGGPVLFIPTFLLFIVQPQPVSNNAQNAILKTRLPIRVFNKPLFITAHLKTRFCHNPHPTFPRQSRCPKRQTRSPYSPTSYRKRCPGNCKYIGSSASRPCSSPSRYSQNCCYTSRSTVLPTDETILPWVDTSTRLARKQS